MSHFISAFSTAINNVQKSIVARNKKFLHPIRRLPAEILQYIFEECIYAKAAEWFEDPSHPPKLLRSATRTPGTCRSWRTITRQTPLIWNQLRAPVQARVGHLRGSKRVTWRTIELEAFQESLHLCRSIPLEVTIPENVLIPEDPNLMSLKIDRLSLCTNGYGCLGCHHFPPVSFMGEWEFSSPI